jgi:hypothetical protein
MKTLCAWCIKEGTQKNAAGVSHGICPRHLAAMLAEIRAAAKVPKNNLRIFLK